MSTSPNPQWLLVGNWSIERAIPILKHVSNRHEIMCETLKSALAVEISVDFVLVLQSFPDEYPPDEIEQMIGHLPLARWIVCYGEWCESMGRSESSWPIGWCVPLREAIPRIDMEIERYFQERPPLPATASRDESFAYHGPASR